MNMSKINNIVVFGLLLLFGLIPYANAAYPPSNYPSIYVNNEKLNIYTFCAKDVTVVPFRPIFEKYKMNVSWDAKTKTVTATKEGITIKLTHNSYDAFVNGNKIMLLQPPSFNKDNGVIYVPLRFISEAINGEVIWKKTSNTETAIYIILQSK